MAKGPAPLTVALAAGVLLVAVLVTDSAINRTVTLEVDDDGTWVELIRAPYMDYSRAYGSDQVVVDRNGTVAFRIVVDNQQPWSFSDTYEVRINGVRVESGVLEAGARAKALVTFDVPGSKVFQPDPGTATERPVKGGFPTFVQVELSVGDDAWWGSFQVTEASA